MNHLSSELNKISDKNIFPLTPLPKKWSLNDYSRIPASTFFLSLQSVKTMFPIERLQSPGLDSLLPVTPKDESYAEEMSRGEAAHWSCGPAWDIVEQSHVQQGETRASLRIWMTLTSPAIDSVSAGWMSHSHKLSDDLPEKQEIFEWPLKGRGGRRQTIISLVYLMLSCRFEFLLISFRYELSLSSAERCTRARSVWFFQ